VDDKWVQTPRGLFPLKRFFGGGTQTVSGAEVSWELWPGVTRAARVDEVRQL
jgi:DNA-directed RNA polymerase specialized sigma54-like protein